MYIYFLFFKKFNFWRQIEYCCLLSIMNDTYNNSHILSSVAVEILMHAKVTKQVL